MTDWKDLPCLFIGGPLNGVGLPASPAAHRTEYRWIEPEPVPLVLNDMELYAMPQYKVHRYRSMMMAEGMEPGLLCVIWKHDGVER